MFDLAQVYYVHICRGGYDRTLASVEYGSVSAQEVTI